MNRGCSSSEMSQHAVWFIVSDVSEKLEYPGCRTESPLNTFNSFQIRFSVLNWIWRKHFPPKRRWTCTRTYGTASLKIEISTLSNLIENVLICLRNRGKVHSHQSFTLVPRSPYFSTVKTKVIFFSETTLDLQLATWRYIPEYSIRHNHRCENLKSCISSLNYLMKLCPNLKSCISSLNCLMKVCPNLKSCISSLNYLMKVCPNLKSCISSLNRLMKVCPKLKSCISSLNYLMKVCPNLKSCISSLNYLMKVCHNLKSCISSLNYLMKVCPNLKHEYALEQEYQPKSTRGTQKKSIWNFLFKTPSWNTDEPV
jgi:hypothetical protein